MRFWRVKSPDYESDYDDSYINGALDHPFGLPGVRCEVCGNTWGGTRILPFHCPAPFRSQKNITDGWPIPRMEHEALQEELMTALALDGEPFVALRPGDDFQPCYLDIPSHPRADFLWGTLGSVIVSERVNAVLIQLCPQDIVSCPVTLRKVGSREADLPPPMPSAGEPEDIINEVPILEDTCGVGAYFEILVTKKSKYPPGGTPTATCLGCKREEVDGTARQLRMTTEMWNGDNIFFLPTTLYIIITDVVRERLSLLRPTNVIFENI